MSKLYANRFIPKYCDLNLPWYEKNYDFIDIAKWDNLIKTKTFT